MDHGINAILYAHLKSGPGAAELLRKNNANVVKYALAFFQARTDINRIYLAQLVANEILSLNDLRDYIPLRDIVATQELNRIIKYSKQQDHTAHTVYLFFFGLWVYDNIHELRGLIQNKLNGSFYTENFLLHWIYGSLLHDVGYAFQNLAEDTKEDRIKIDGLFSAESVIMQYKDPSIKTKTALAAAVSAWGKQFDNKINISTLAANQYNELIRQLSYAPWIGDLDSKYKDKDIFMILDPNQWGLRKYAEEIASNGYDGDGNPAMDHAIASGLFLLQYTTFWYWIIDHINKHNPDCYNEARGETRLSGPYNYNISNITEDFIPACKTIAFHNIIPSVASASGIIENFTWENEPFICLAITCDILQLWDRIPSGEKHLRGFHDYAKQSIETEDVYLASIIDNKHLKAYFKLYEPGSSCTSLYSKANDIKEALQMRLVDYERHFFIPSDGRRMSRCAKEKGVVTKITPPLVSTPS